MTMLLWLAQPEALSIFLISKQIFFSFQVVNSGIMVMVRPKAWATRMLMGSPHGLEITGETEARRALVFFQVY